MHWVKWDKLCEAKEVGGLGFKEIEKLNDALLAKQVQRMINNPDSLCHRVFKARFFRIAQSLRQGTLPMAPMLGNV